MTPSFELDRCEHTERRMATLAVVKDLVVLKHRVREVNASDPSFSVEQLDLHPTPNGDAPVPSPLGGINRRVRLGGLIHEYARLPRAA